MAAIISGDLVKTVYQVTCDHPAGGGREYGLNVFWYTGPTAFADAEIQRLELLVLGRANVRLSKNEHRRVRTPGRPVADTYRWSEVA